MVAFRDRDFDAEPGASVALVRLNESRGKEIYLSLRSCIESYMLEPELLRSYWEQACVGPAWHHSEPPDVATIRAWIEGAARTIAEYEAVRWALAKVKPEARWPLVPTTWMKASGDLPPSLDFSACATEARSLVNEYARVTRQVTEPLLERHMEQFRRRFSEESFWATSGYVVWFHGKDLQKAMQRMKPDLFSLRHFFGWASLHLDWQRHADLVELSRLL